MIGVVADDLTGAAELGAVGLRHGLTPQVVLAGEPSGDANLVCLDTDSRSCVPREAACRAASAASLLRQHRANWIYKKTDSVLRGNVTPELEAIIAELNLDGALLVPANPSLGRTIADGQYLIRGQLIHQTEFARDPTYPRLTPKVRDLIATPVASGLFILRPEEGLPERGIVIGEVTDSEGLRTWAALRKPRWLMAGGAEFFGALLHMPVVGTSPTHFSGKEVFVCGSASEVTRSFVARQAAQGERVFSLPQELASGSALKETTLNRLADQVVTALSAKPRVILHVGLPPVKHVSIAETLALHLVRVAAHVIRRVKAAHVFAEGGATAVALAQEMGWRRLEVTAELAPGVVRLSGIEDASSLTIKPGSYDWPKTVL